jgi:hypothetical protein
MVFNLVNNLCRSILKNEHITYFELHTLEIKQFCLEWGDPPWRRRANKDIRKEVKVEEPLFSSPFQSINTFT